MTATTSTSDSKKSFFKDYLFYNIRSRKIILLASSICAFFSSIILPIIILNTEKQQTYNLNNEQYSISAYLNVFMFTSIFFLFFISITNGISVFQHLTSKKKTDTLMSLPLTHGERFWGDFLTGFTISVAPSILFGIVGIIFACVTNNQEYQTFGLSSMFIITLVFSLIFNYLISVLAASICGNKVGGMFVSGILNVVALLLPEYLLIFFSSTTAGLSAQFDEIQQMISPPSTSFFSLLANIDLGRHDRIPDCFPLSNPVIVCLYILLFAGITMASYFLAKRRNAEHNGEIFAIKHGSTVASILIAVTFSFLADGMFISGTYPVFTSIIIAITCVLVFTASELVLRQGVKKLGKRIAVYGTATAAVIGIALISTFTHGFGISNYIPSADKITSVELVTQDNNLVLSTDNKEDIEIIRTKHTNILEKYISNLTGDKTTYLKSNLSITYTLENGKKYVRHYNIHFNDLNPDQLDFQKCKKALNTLPQLSKEYSKQYSQYAAEEIKNANEIVVYLKGMHSGYTIKANKFNDNRHQELAEIYSQDVLNNFTPNALPIGNLLIYFDTKHYIKLDILESYTNTIEFLKNPDNLHLPPDSQQYEYIIRFYSDHDSIRLDVKIMTEDLNNTYVQQLEALMIEVNPNDIETIYNYDKDKRCIRCGKNDYYVYFIPAENFDKAKELIIKIISERAPEPDYTE